MTCIYNYVTAVTKRFPKMRETDLSSYRLLAHDIKADIDINHISYPTDAELLEYVESRLHTDEQRKALRDFKRHYHAWLRRSRGSK